MEMGRNAGFEAGAFGLITPLDYLANFMQTGDNSGLIVRHSQLEKLPNWAQLAAQLV